MMNLSPNGIISIIDFAKNYLCKWQNEVQSQHWLSFLVTILMHITFWLHSEWDGVDLEMKLLIEYHFYICYNKIHGKYFVQ